MAESREQSSLGGRKEKRKGRRSVGREKSIPFDILSSALAKFIEIRIGELATQLLLR
jgi:hypothetical protein